MTPLSPHDLQNFLFCPRTLWWRHVAGLRTAPTAAQRAGAQLHAQAQALPVHTLNLLLGLHAIRYEAEVHARDARWSGRADLVAHTPAGWLPIELKLSHDPDHPAHLLQLALYARLLSAHAPSPIREGILWLATPARHAPQDPLDRLTGPHAIIRRVPLDDPALDARLDALHAQISALLADEPFPTVDHPIARCELCPLIPFCHDRTPWRDAEEDTPHDEDLPPELAALLSPPSTQFI